MTRWIEGAGHGLVWSHGLAILGPGLGVEQASRIWERFAAGGDLAAFLKVLSAESGADLLSLPAFAVALRDGSSDAAAGGWQLAARGELEVRADGEVVRGTSVSTWNERRIPGAASVEIGALTDGDAVARPIAAGVVPAAGVTWSSDSSAAPRVDAPATPLPLPLPVPASLPDAPVPAVPAVDALPAEDAVASVPAVESAFAVDPAPLEDAVPEAPAEAQETLGGLDDEAPVDEVPVDEVPVGADAVPEPAEPEVEPEHDPAGPEAEARPALAPQPPQPLPPAASDVAPQTGRFARQFGETQLWSVEDAAVRGEEPLLISSVPSGAGASGPQPAIDDEGDHDGYTMMADAFAVAPAQAPVGAAEEPPPGVPAVLGVECPQGHANPPQRSTCGTCGAALEGEPHRVARPSLGRLVLPNGERVELTSPVIVGRNPRADRVQGSVLPRLVPLSQGHISGSHLEVRLEEWHVLAVDLHSTNGTYLRRHGEAPVRLGERPELLIAGDVLDFGHGVQITVEQLL